VADACAQFDSYPGFKAYVEDAMKHAVEPQAKRTSEVDGADSP
jgi:hypothetical protein